MKFKSDRRRRLSCLILGSVLLSAGQSASAAQEQRQNFHAFRDANPGLSRRAARMQFRGEGRRPDISQVVSPATVLMPAISSITPRIHSLASTLQLNEKGRLLRLERGINLDLSSQDKSIVLGENLLSGSVDIRVGDGVQTLVVGDRVTAAEYTAVKQVLAGQDQGLTLNNSGQAVDGKINLVDLTDQNDVLRAKNLVVPASVTALGDFARGSSIRLLGDLDNFGTVETLASNRVNRPGAIQADNIFNHADAAIFAKGDLTLQAGSNFNNEGTISSQGNLEIVAGQLTNSGHISAASDLNLSAQSIKNSGNVASTTGNITLSAPAGTDSTNLIIDNTNGTLSALQGAININPLGFAGKQDSFLNGGNVNSLQLNLNSGEGAVDVNVNELSGAVYSTGSAVHVSATTEELTIGKTCLTGDPTFFNTAGSIAINGDIAVAEALTIVAAGDINLNNGADLTANNATRGFPITLIAGANFSNTGGSNQGTIGPIPPANTNNGSVTINGGSATGGGINFNSSSGIDTIISTRASGGVGNGDNVTLVAFAGSGGNSGRINTGLPTFDRIFTGGKVNGTNGNITIIAPGISNGGKFLPELNTAGGTGAGGDITITATNPIANNVTYNAAGQLTSPPITGSGGITTNGEIRFVNVDAGRATVTASANLVQVAGNTSLKAGRANFSGGAISLFGNVITKSVLNVSAFGTIATQFGGTIGQVTSPVSILASTNGVVGAVGSPFKLNGGTVYASASTGVNLQSTSGLAIAGGSVANGDFTVAAAGNTSITGDVSVGTGNINIATSVGSITAGAVNVLTNSGNVSLNASSADKKTAKINLAGTNITALGAPAVGDITIAVGTIGAPVAGKTPTRNVQINNQGGQIFFGAKGLNLLPPTSNFTADTATILFNNPYAKGNIVLSGVTLVAAPD